MPVRDEIRRILDALSEYECEHLLNTVQNIAAGERFWETAIGTLYNEYVKTRSNSSTSDLAPGAPVGEAGIFAPIPVTKSYPSTTWIPLPDAERLNETLAGCLLHRRSRRHYSGVPMTGAQLSTLLQLSCGVTGTTVGYGYDHLALRSFPSSGGLQTPEVYVSVQRVAGVPAGLYHYRPAGHGLEQLKLGNHGPILSGFALAQPYVERAAAVLLITGCFARLRWKYGERAYRYMCMDVGCLIENLYLVGEALDLGVCAIAGFIDDAIERLLSVDGEDEVALVLVTLGPRAPGT